MFSIQSALHGFGFFLFFFIKLCFTSLNIIAVFLPFTDERFFVFDHSLSQSEFSHNSHHTLSRHCSRVGATNNAHNTAPEWGHMKQRTRHCPRVGLKITHASLLQSGATTTHTTLLQSGATNSAHNTAPEWGDK